MALDPETVAAIELELARAKGQVAGAMIGMDASADARLIADAVLQAGLQIALAIYAQAE